MMENYINRDGKLILNIGELTKRDEVELIFSGQDNFIAQLDIFCGQDVTGTIKKSFLFKNFERVLVNSLNLNKVEVSDDSLETLEGREEYVRRVLNDLKELIDELKIDIELNLELKDEIIEDIFSDSNYEPEYLAYCDHINRK
jgi:hypothetical protein